MGRRGPQPTPTKVLQARGSWRAKTRGDEPQVEPGRPPRPRWIAPKGKKLFDELAVYLEDIGVMTQLDGLALGLLCDAWSDYVENKTRENRKHLLLLLREFGLSPASRASVKASEFRKIPDDEAEQYFAKQRLFMQT